MPSCAKCHHRWNKPEVHCFSCHASWIASRKGYPPKVCLKCGQLTWAKRGPVGYSGVDQGYTDSNLKRAIALGVPHQGKIFLMNIYKRDQGICYLCGKDVVLYSTHADGWSIDHVIPMSQGGPHL